MKINKTLAITFLLIFSVDSWADVANGEKLYQANCTACHAINEKVVGPALKDVHKRREEKWLVKWIRNSQALIKSGDAVAIQVYKENNEALMTSFENLSENDVKDIIEYIKVESENAGKPKTAEVATVSESAQNNGNSNGGSGFYSQTTFYALSIMVVILLIIVFILYRLKNVVDELYAQKYPEAATKEVEHKISWKNNPYDFRFKLFKKHPIVGGILVVLLFTIVMGLVGFDYGNRKIGVQKGYAPVQPINYSHELHAGKYQINCLYCHSSADKSKQASIPSASTCMNCHMHVQAKEKYNGQVSPEIQKIYDAVGWDAEKRAYLANYEQKPIKWVRIHNLPDLAYFNHAQHVQVGKVECQACHGPIETMAVVSQQKSLQMGWCINCHREAKVDMANNDYYEELHAKYKAEGIEYATVAKNGGLECGKCHY